MKREATCSCGALRVICSGDPELVSLCNCIECQKRTGAPFGVAAFFLRDNVEVSGEHRSYKRSSDSGHDITFHFCPVCGSNVLWEPASKPEYIAVAAGSFGDKHFPKPSQEVFVESRHDWIMPL
ncbi:MAG: GFA family protein [Pseudomonadota bacterium]